MYSRVFHLNMLRKWHAPSAVGYWAQELERERGEADDVPFWNEGAEDGTSDAATLGEQLSVQQKQDLQDLMDENTCNIEQQVWSHVVFFFLRFF